MFTLGHLSDGTTAVVTGYTLGSTAATPLPDSPYVLTQDLPLACSGTDGASDASAAGLLALADDYLYILCIRNGGSSFGGGYVSYSVSSSGLTLVSHGGAPPDGAFAPNMTAMISYAGNIYFVSSRDSANSPSTIETGESYLDIAQASNGVLTFVNSVIPLDNCNAIAANIDASTAQLLISCAPGTGTPTALIIPLATPTVAPTAITIPTPTSGTVGQSLLVDGYLYVIVNGMTDVSAPGDGIQVFQSFSVDPSGAVTFIQQYSLGTFGPGGAVWSIAAGDGHLFYSYVGYQTLGGAGAVQISAGNMTASAVEGFIAGDPEGNIFFDAPAAMVLTNYQYRSYGTLVMPLATPGIDYGVGSTTSVPTVFGSVVGN
jgi:hypothetical protein